VLSVGGAYSTPGNGPFPVNGLIPVLKPLYDYSWVVGLGTGFAVYLVLSLFGRAVSGQTGDTPAG
jgi:nucleobase:cation symporter-1, NCS1 family